MDVPKTKGFKSHIDHGDTTESGLYCINRCITDDGKPEQLEKVSDEQRYTCHNCGSIIEVHFEGFR